MPLYRAQRGSNDEILQSPNEKSCGPEQDLVTGHSNGLFESTEDMEYLETESLDNNAMARATPLINPQHHSTIFSYETDESVTSSSEDECLEECLESLFGDYCSSSSDNEVLSHLSDDMFLPLYPGADITACGAYFAIMQLKKLCRLSFSTMSEILRLLQLLCPKNNKLPSTIHHLRKFYSTFESSKRKTLFCPNCSDQVLDKCKKLECLRKGSANSDPYVLIQLDIPLQLKTILSRKYNLLFCIVLTKFFRALE